MMGNKHEAHSYQELVDSLSPELYRRLLSAVETGKWPDGRPLSAEQREHTLQAVIAWSERHLPPEQRVGFIDRGRKEQAARDSEAAPSEQTAEHTAEQTLRWLNELDGTGGTANKRPVPGRDGR